MYSQAAVNEEYLLGPVYRHPHRDPARAKAVEERSRLYVDVEALRPEIRGTGRCLFRKIRYN